VQGLAAMGVAVWGAWVVMSTSVGAARGYLGTFVGDCGVRSGEAFQLEVVATLTLLIPGAGWWLAERVGRGAGICRGAFYAALAGWVTAEVMAHAGRGRGGRDGSEWMW
jgi:hypothetical protein